MVTIKHIEVNNEPMPFKFGSLWYTNVVAKQKIKNLEELIARLTSMDTGFITHILMYANESACSDLNKPQTHTSPLYYHGIIDSVGLAEIIKLVSTSIIEFTGVSTMDPDQLNDIVTKSTKKK